ncbi:MAG: response regulator transcription factor [Dehalococcoidia bacterium]|nr:response regulator transcription factor [Dehalococcoidia bacterium]
MSSASVLLIGSQVEPLRELGAALSERGLSCRTAAAGDLSSLKLSSTSLDLVLVAAQTNSDGPAFEALTRKIRAEKRVPLIALLAGENLDDLDPGTYMDDFVIKPWNPDEVVARVKRILRHRTGLGRGECITCGDLVIDLDNCEVTVSGHLATLTFREYELLKFLARNRGRVFTRDSLLNEVWGYDYYGGDRTVDVHIRRLRGKIEDSTHVFIETVRNIGYRFKKDS